MKDFDLNEMSSEELHELRADVDLALRDFEKRKKKQALAAVKEAARKFGFDLGELVDAAKSKGKSAATPKYAHPDDPEKTWTGRGRQPDWFKEGVAQGKSPEDFLI